jgi:hypothetical protein
MGSEILPFEEGDQLKYENFVIMGEHSWKPSLYHEEADEDAEAEMNPYNTNILIGKYFVGKHSFDPENQEIPMVGYKVQVNFDPKFVLTKANAIATWHRVNYKDIDPKLLRPYLAWRPLRNVKNTLSRTTQMAKMIVNRPLRKHK